MWKDDESQSVRVENTKIPFLTYQIGKNLNHDHTALLWSCGKQVPSYLAGGVWDGASPHGKSSGRIYWNPTHPLSSNPTSYSYTWTHRKGPYTSYSLQLVCNSKDLETAQRSPDSLNDDTCSQWNTTQLWKRIKTKKRMKRLSSSMFFWIWSIQGLSLSEKNKSQHNAYTFFV